ncbi:MAG: hypothetical protein V4858_03170 [Pseudomonadota bacterium]
MEIVDDDFDPNADFEGDLITVVGSAFHQPIADLIGRLAERNPNPSESYMAGHYENGYCASIVMLLVLAFESYVTRVSYRRFREHGETRDPKKKISTVDYLCSLDSGFPYVDALTEAYIIRDSLAHAHLWQVDYVIRRDRTDVTKRELFQGYGDIKMRARVDLNTGKTKYLGLNVLPTSIGVPEAATVFRVIAESLRHLANAGLVEQAAVGGHVGYGRKQVQFWSLHAVLAEMANPQNGSPQ